MSTILELIDIAGWHAGKVYGETHDGKAISTEPQHSHDPEVKRQRKQRLTRQNRFYGVFVSLSAHSKRRREAYR